MKNLIIGLTVGIILGFTLSAVADPSWISKEAIWNKVFNTTSEAITISFQ